VKSLVSLAVALTVIPAGAQAAHSATGDPPARPPVGNALEAAIADPPRAGAAERRARQARVVRLGHRARAHARRLGLTPPPAARPAQRPELLERQERRLRRVNDFLSSRREMSRPVDERPTPAGVRSGASLASKLVHQHRRAARLATRLGVQPPQPLEPAATARARGRQLAHWRAVSRWLSARSERVRRAERPLSQRIPHFEELTCIAEHESHGDWSISTGNGYYGGLQMDRAFQRTYAPRLYRAKGTADNWTREEQMRTAERAIRSRGFSPWPNTARMCGVL